MVQIHGVISIGLTTNLTFYQQLHEKIIVTHLKCNSKEGKCSISNMLKNTSNTFKFKFKQKMTFLCET